MSVVAASGPAPVPQGGALADGTYVMTSATAYGTKNADGATLEAIGTATIAVSGSTLQVVLLDDKGKVEHQTYTITLSGSAMTTTQTCRDPGKLEAAQTGQFTATPTTLHTIIPAGGTSTYDIVYTRQ